jgi:hypothetical protein
MKCKDDSGFSLSHTFVHLAMSGKVRAIEVAPDFFRAFKSREDLQNGRLMGALDITEGSSHWEMHPDGDEFLYLYPALWMLSWKMRSDVLGYQI